MSSKPRVVRRVAAFATPWFEVVAKHVERGSGPESEPYYVLQLPDYVTVLAVTTRGQIPLVRQFRPAAEEHTLELPSGHVDPGEDPAVAAARELREETGYDAPSLTLLGSLTPDTGRLGNRLWCFLAEGVPAHPISDWTPEPDVEVELHDRSALRGLIAGGQLRHALDLALITLAQAKTGWSS